MNKSRSKSLALKPQGYKHIWEARPIPETSSNLQALVGYNLFAGRIISIGAARLIDDNKDASTRKYSSQINQTHVLLGDEHYDKTDNAG